MSASIKIAPMSGHWDTFDGAALAREYVGMARADLTHGSLSDFAVANEVFLSSRDALDLIVWQTAAKERIRWLSVQLAIALGGEA